MVFPKAFVRFGEGLLCGLCSHVLLYFPGKTPPLCPLPKCNQWVSPCFIPWTATCKIGVFCWMIYPFRYLFQSVAKEITTYVGKRRQERKAPLVVVLGTEASFATFQRPGVCSLSWTHCAHYLVRSFWRRAILFTRAVTANNQTCRVDLLSKDLCQGVMDPYRALRIRTRPTVRGPCERVSFHLCLISSSA